MSAVMNDAWITVGALDEIPRLGSRVVKTADDEIAIFRAADDTVFALSNRCPHQGGPLAEGILYGHRITCPLHNWVIELESGEALAPDVGCARSYPVRVEKGVVSIAL